ncbi:MAG: AraC family transcriptional regulator [Puniceicoccaceae bacterium]|nr:MAG: AraC family transcriptional regulator [Puniceicoccaceae bacterium]
MESLQKDRTRANRRCIPHRLDAVQYYRQTPGVQPRPRGLVGGEEWIELVTGGRGWVEDEGGWQEVGAGDLLWHVAGDSTIGRSDPEDPYRCLAVRFTTEGGSGRRVPRFTRWPDLEAVEAFAREAVRWYLDESTPREALRACLFGRLLLAAVQGGERAGRSPRAAALRRVWARIERDHGRPLRLADLGAEAGWSVAHLHEVFREETGRTPHEALTARRILAAKERLVLGGEPVKRIAVECGFTHAAAFCHAFKRATGLTPSRFRAAHQRLPEGGMTSAG